MSIYWVYLIATAFTVSILHFFFGEKKQAEPAFERAKAYRRRSLMTSPEKQMFSLLAEAFPGYMVCPQLALSALVEVDRSFLKSKQLQELRSWIADLTLDYVVLDKQSGDVVLIVELDDKSHDSLEAKAFDKERDDLLEKQGYKVQRYDMRTPPSVEALQADLLRRFLGKRKA